MNFQIAGAWLKARLHLGERDQAGANLVEYILLVVFIALVVVGAVVILGGSVDSKFTEANTCLNAVDGC